MGYLKERVSYLRGLAEGMQLNDSTNEGKLLKAMLEVMDDIALAVEDVEEMHNQLGDQVDSIDENLAELESVVYDEDEDDEEGEICFREVECPYCEETVSIDDDMLEDDNTVECPNCHKTIRIEDECCCEKADEDE